jgi:hypothetical protein
MAISNRFWPLNFSVESLVLREMVPTGGWVGLGFSRCTGGPSSFLAGPSGDQENPQNSKSQRNGQKRDNKYRRSKKKMTGKPGEIVFLPQPQLFCKKQKVFDMRCVFFLKWF